MGILLRFNADAECRFADDVQSAERDSVKNVGVPTIFRMFQKLSQQSPSVAIVNLKCYDLHSTCRRYCHGKEERSPRKAPLRTLFQVLYSKRSSISFDFIPML